MKEEESLLERLVAQAWPGHGFVGLKLDKVNLDLAQILVYNKGTISLANGIDVLIARGTWSVRRGTDARPC